MRVVGTLDLDQKSGHLEVVLSAFDGAVEGEEEGVENNLGR